MRNTVSLFVLLATLAVGGVLAVQYQSNRRVTSELTAFRQELAHLQAATPVEVAERPPAVERLAASGNAGLHQRLAALEQAVAQLTRASDYLMERGQLPLATNRLENLLGKLSDPNASHRDRLQALRLLRRNGALTEDAVASAVGWLSSATNGNVREDVLEQLDGLTNAVLRAPLLALAAGDTDADVRERAVENLQRFAGDPQVDAQLWQSLMNDPEDDVRRQAREALVEGPASETRLAGFRERAANPNSSVEEKAVAWEALREANQPAPEVSAALAQLAETTQDSEQRMRLFQSFDDANDPAFVPSLVQGLQDSNPLVRERAADALSDYRSDPKVQEWLRYVAENDADPTVRREAFRGLGNRRN
jgi:HEAT repeat protein